MEIIKGLVEQSELIAIILIPIVSGFVQVFKNTLNLQDRYVPLLSLVTGATISMTIVLSAGQPLTDAIIVGLISGLGACGLYDQKKIGDTSRE